MYLYIYARTWIQLTSKRPEMKTKSSPFFTAYLQRCTLIWMHLCVSVFWYVYWYAFACIVIIFIDSYVHVCEYAYIHVHACVYACAYAYQYAYVRVYAIRICPCVRICIRIVCMDVCIYICTHPCVHGYLDVYKWKHLFSREVHSHDCIQIRVCVCTHMLTIVCARVICITYHTFTYPPIYRLHVCIEK